jgi:chemotaxis signal transduction protein
MTTVVRFRVPTGEYALPVEHVVEVRSSGGITPLPEPRPGIVGLLRQDDDALTVLSILGEPGDHVIVIDEGGVTFGLLVEEVTRVHAVADDQIGPPPPGQDGTMVSGVLVGEDGLVLLLDCVALRGRLTP